VRAQEAALRSAAAPVARRMSVVPGASGFDAVRRQHSTELAGNGSGGGGLGAVCEGDEPATPQKQPGGGSMMGGASASAEQASVAAQQAQQAAADLGGKALSAMKGFGGRFGKKKTEKFDSENFFD
jgi:hypothetical protein